MKKLLLSISFIMTGCLCASAGVLEKEYTVADMGSQQTTQVAAGTYIISGIDQSSREYFLYDSGSRVLGDAAYPAANASTASFLWTLTAEGTGWVITNVATGSVMNLGNSNGSSISTSSNAQTNAIHFGSDGYITILNANGQAIDMTANGSSPTTWTGTTTPTGSRRLKIYAAENIQLKKEKVLTLVPAPKNVVFGDGETQLAKGSLIFVDEIASEELKQDILSEVARFMTTVNKATDLNLSATDSEAEINIAINPEIAVEGYVLDVEQNVINIQVSTARGLSYAFTSLMRLLPPNVPLGKKAETAEIAQEYKLPVVRIEDEPRFRYRGFMLDVSRHFFTLEEVRKMIDLMAMYKMNVFHWHLTDDQGWRAEIKRYPKLTTIGATRKNSYETPIYKILENGQEYWTGEGGMTGKSYGPFFYTQEEMKGIVEYAAERHIDVLPEVDMPGHFTAALAAYPEYSCNPSNVPEVWVSGGISNTVLNVANTEAVQFAKNIITELAEIFPYPYFHIGGDECPTLQWEGNTACQEKLASLGKTSYRALQTEFIREINQHLKTLGKKMFCWNESITESGADLDLMRESGATIMCWNPCQAGAAKAASLGLNAIISEWGSGCYYINRKQSNDYGEPSAAGTGNDPASATYNYMPVPSSVTAEAAKYYIGVQATFWTEHVGSNEFLEYLALPRFMCVAEAGWSPQEKKSWAEFVDRMTVETEILSLGNYVFARHWMKDYTPRQAPAPAISDGNKVTFTNKSTDRGRCLADENGVLNGQGSECTYWVLEQASAENNTYYLRSDVSNKYLYAGNGNSGTMVQLSNEKTAWAFDTKTISGYSAICYESTDGKAINNNVSNTTKLRLFDHGTGNGASFWEIITPQTIGEGEMGVLAYHYVYRGMSLLRKEFILEQGTAFPDCAPYVPDGYIIDGNFSVSGAISLKSEIVEIPIAPAPTVGIKAPETSATYTSNVIYNLKGQRLIAPQQGVNIINGKIVVVK